MDAHAPEAAQYRCLDIAQHHHNWPLSELATWTCPRHINGDRNVDIAQHRHPVAILEIRRSQLRWHGHVP
eukprot:3359806-Lingulodinium_polyedra.AAC.1